MYDARILQNWRLIHLILVPIGNTNTRMMHFLLYFVGASLASECLTTLEGMLLKEYKKQI